MPCSKWQTGPAGRSELPHRDNVARKLVATYLFPHLLKLWGIPWLRWLLDLLGLL